MLFRAVAAYAKDIKGKIRTQLENLVKEGIRFSGTTDEWTAKNRRYSCVNVHLPGGESVRLGLVRVKGSMPAEVAAEIFRKKLEEYGIEESKMVAGTTDGASGTLFLWIFEQIYLQKKGF